MSTEFQIDASDLKDLSRQMRAASRAMQAEVDRSLLKVGVRIEAVTKAIAEEHSEKVASTVRMRPVPGAVVIEAGNQDTPIAVLWELGNRGSKRSARTFRHRVFGQDVWVEQDKHPFMAPARARTRRETVAELERAWDRAISRSGAARRI